jgi:starch-binding outer membrane protein, SusD/RagB family
MMMRTRFLRSGLVAAAAVAAASCSADRFLVANPNSPTVASGTANPLGTLPLLATNVLVDERASLTTFVLDVGILGREAYNYTPLETRNTTGFLGQPVLTNTSFGAEAIWANPYKYLRDVALAHTVVNAAATGVFSTAQLSAINGFLDTFEALELLYIIDTRNQIGAPVAVSTNPSQLEPFVSRDSVYNYIIGKLTAAQTELANGGAAFPFALDAGYAGFDTPPTFAMFTSGLLARVQAYRASLGVAGCAALSATCYQAVLTALQSSWISTSGSLQTGPFEIYSAAAGDLLNTDSWVQSSKAVLAEAKSDSGVELQANGTQDARFLTKVMSIPSEICANPTACIATTWAFALYPLGTSPISIMRNEELILLRAEAEYFTGDAADALSDINVIRTTSGDLAARGPFVSQSDFVTELLYNRRESLMFEGGHQWIDKRRFGLLNTLPLDIPSDVIVDHLLLPEEECAARVGAAAGLQAPANSGC